MAKGKKRVHVEMAPGTRLAADLLKMSEKCNRYLATKYDSAGVREHVNQARAEFGAAAEIAQALPETWKPGKPKKPMSAEQIKKLEAKAAKLAEQIAEAKAAQA